MAGVHLRNDFNDGAVRALARAAQDGPQVRRILALAVIYEGAARVLDDWHWPRLALAQRVEPGPTPDLRSPELYGVVRWRVIDLCQWIVTECRSRSPGRP